MNEWDGKERRRTTVCAYHNQLTKKIGEMHEGIYGNGDPKKGLYWMVSENTNFITNVKKIFWPMVIASSLGVSSAFINFLITVYNHMG